MHNGEILCDTTDRIGALITVCMITKSEIATGAKSRLYDVTLNKGVKIADVEQELEKMWTEEKAPAKEIRVGGKVWRSTIPAGDVSDPASPGSALAPIHPC